MYPFIIGVDAGALFILTQGRPGEQSVNRTCAAMLQYDIDPAAKIDLYKPVCV